MLVWLTWAFIAAVLALLVLTYNLFPGWRTVALAFDGCVARSKAARLTSPAPLLPTSVPASGASHITLQQPGWPLI